MAFHKFVGASHHRKIDTLGDLDDVNALFMLGPHCLMAFPIWFSEGIAPRTPLGLSEYAEQFRQEVPRGYNSKLRQGVLKSGVVAYKHPLSGDQSTGDLGL